jgi:hypothetical protein
VVRAKDTAEGDCGPSERGRRPTAHANGRPANHEAAHVPCGERSQEVRETA